MRYNNNPKEDLRKNNPRKFAPILNTIFSGIIIIVIIILKIFTEHVSWPLFFAFLIVLIMFPIASWYNFYFSRKTKTKMLKTYEEETNLIVEYLNHQKNFICFNKEMNRDISTSFTRVDSIDLKFNYNSEVSSFGFPDSNNALVSIGIGFTNLVLDPKTYNVIGLCGLAPKSIWVKKKLKLRLDNCQKGLIHIEPKNFDFNEKTLYQTLLHSDSYYDKKQGLLCIGERKIYDIDDVINFIENGYLVLRDDKIVGLWLFIDKDLQVF